MVVEDRIADLRLHLASGRQLARCRDAMKEHQLHRRTVTVDVATAQRTGDVVGPLPLSLGSPLMDDPVCTQIRTALAKRRGRNTVKGLKITPD